MQKKTFLGILVLLFISLLPLSGKCEEKQITRPYEEINKQINADRKLFDFTVKTDKETYKIGEPIYIIGTWKNDTNKDIFVKNPDYTFGFSRILIEDSTRSANYEFVYMLDSYQLPPGEKPENKPIKPNQIKQVKVNLTESFVFKPGRYYIYGDMPSKSENRFGFDITVEE